MKIICCGARDFKVAALHNTIKNKFEKSFENIIELVATINCKNPIK
ncbi:hypothetical protein [Spiroplasma endosymbiont of Panorpa germanica]